MFNRRLTFFCYIFLFFLSPKSYSQEYIDSFITKFQIVVHFDSGKHDLIQSDKEILDKLVKKVKSNSSHYVSVSSHTDKVGSNYYNNNLSKRRTTSIVNYLIKNGIKSKIIDAKYFGETRPKVKEIDEKTRRTNRRGIVRLVIKTKLLKITGIVLDDNNKPIKNATLELKSNEYKSETKSNKLGEFVLYTPTNKNIDITASAKDHFFNNIEIRKQDLKKYPKIKLVVPKITSGKKFIAKNILFIPAKSDLLPSSYDELRLIERSMLLNNKLCIEIAGHINGQKYGNIPRDSYHFGLSIARALTIHEVLINHGIDSSRMIAKGYGNWEMIYPNTTDLGLMRFNRRVELIVSDCDSIQNIKNDFTPYNFSEVPINENYNFDNLSAKLKFFTKKQKRKILITLKYLKSKKINPTDFTYLQLIEFNIPL